MKSRITSIIVGLFLLTAFGCNKETLPEGMPKINPITLVFTADGSTPLEGASVTLVPENKEMAKWLAGGTTDAKGECVIRTLSRYNGAPAGKYKVIVQKTVVEGGSGGEVSDQAGGGGGGSVKSFHLVGKKFRAPNTTPLEIDVVDGANPTVTLDTEKPVRESISLSAG